MHLERLSGDMTTHNKLTYLSNNQANTTSTKVTKNKSAIRYPLKFKDSKGLREMSSVK